MNNYKKEYMDRALLLAEKAFHQDEVPIGAVVVHNDQIIGEGFNTRERSGITSNHAEVIAITEACKSLKSWKLDNCQIYITSEPCIMCSGTIIQSRISTVYYGCKDDKNGCASSLIDIFNVDFTHKVEVYGGFEEKKCSNLLTSFFKKLRK